MTNPVNMLYSELLSQQRVIYKYNGFKQNIK